MRGPGRPSAPLLLFGPAIAVGVVALFVSMGARGADPRFVSAQQHPSVIEPGALSRAVAQTHEPLPGNHGQPARHASCVPGSAIGPLRNPWSCSVLYRSGRTVTYVITVRQSGVFHGENARGDASIDGHVRAPGAG